MKTLVYILAFLCGILFSWFITHSILKVNSEKYIEISEQDFMLIHEMGYLDGIKSKSLDNWPTDSLKAVKRFHEMCDASEK